MSDAAPEKLWEPTAELVERSRLREFMRWLGAERGLGFATYDELWQWSVDDLEAFWSAIWDFFGVQADGEYEQALGSREMPGAEWFGFGGVRILPDLGSEVLLIPLAGHSLGHSGVAIKTGEGWLLHCGDAYFHHDELASPPSCPPGLRFFQNLNNADRRQRLSNQERLRELVARHGEEVRLLCSHDPQELDLAQAAAAAAAA